MHVELEQSSTSDDLQGRQNDTGHIDVRDEHIARDLSDMLQEAKVEFFVLQPGQFQVSIDVSAVGVAIAQISVMMLAI